MSRVSLSTLLDRSNKNMAGGTHPVVRESALEVIRRAYAEGINVQVSEGHRSYARQNALYAQGRTTSGNIVTNARGGQSWHNFGIAVDYFLTNHSGNKAVWTVNANWRRVGQIAKDLGFEWGGDWTSFRDYPHIQMTGGLTIAQMRAGRKPNLVSKVVTTQSSKAGWVKNNTGWWWQNADGTYPRNEWKKVKDVWYYFGNRGYIATGWKFINKRWYYFHTNGAMRTGWIKPNTSWYYLNSNGAMATGWKKVNGLWYYLNSSGRMQTGLTKVNNKDYYLQRNGALITDEIIKLEANMHGHLK